LELLLTVNRLKTFLSLGTVINAPQYLSSVIPFYTTL
jgi:hypothetical protein